ncbi:hypothetical protein, partial [Klebsiella pneumoniae]
SDSKDSSIWLYLIPILCLVVAGGILITIKRQQSTKKEKHQTKTIFSPQKSNTSDTGLISIIPAATAETIEKEEIDETLLPDAITK